MTDPILKVENLVKTFGGVTATDNVNFDVMPGEIHAVIGPNGAGKTTFVAQISGMLKSDSGSITFDGRNISRLNTPQRSHIGLARSFQITSVFKDFTMALATGPRMLMLDEPTAGMGTEESEQMRDFLMNLKGQYSMLLIEHDMDVVFALADRISVLVYGQIIASGSPEEVRNDDAVKRAYLGDEAA